MQVPAELPLYLDCAATTPIDPVVRETVLHYLDVDFGNSGSRTHEYGQRAKKAVERAREYVAAVVGAEPDEVVFTSGATESNNLALLGLAAQLEKRGRKHIVSTAIEHKAVLEPLERLAGRGFEVTLVEPTASGLVRAEDVAAALRPDTGLVSVMHVNNETGVVQPIEEIARRLASHEAYFHVDAAQGFGKEIEALREKRIDLVSISGHKIYAPKGVGALMARRRGFDRVPIEPLMVGGGQERGIRPGTLPVFLIAGLGTAAREAIARRGERATANRELGEIVDRAMLAAGATLLGQGERLTATARAFILPNTDAEAFFVATRGLVAVSSGAACASASYATSHVLRAMGLDEKAKERMIRVSWWHGTDARVLSERVIEIASSA